MDNPLNIINKSGEGDKLCVDGHIRTRKLTDFEKATHNNVWFIKYHIQLCCSGAQNVKWVDGMDKS